MTKNKFEDLVSAAIDNVPEIYQEKLQNVNFRIEDEPTPEQRKKLGLRKCDALFGLFEGVPLTSRNGAVHGIVPDIITIFKNPMTQIFQDTQSLKTQVYETVWHEVAHFYGLNHNQIDKAKKTKT